jgi:hypothetical protein
MLVGCQSGLAKMQDLTLLFFFACWLPHQGKKQDLTPRLILSSRQKARPDPKAYLKAKSKT